MCSICQSLNPTALEVYDSHTPAYGELPSVEEVSTSPNWQNANFNSFQSTTIEDGSATSGKPIYSLDQIADYLTDGYWNGYQRSFNLGPDRSLDFDVTDLTATGKVLARAALDTWSDVSGISFREVIGSGSADITFDDDQSGAFAQSSYSGNTLYSSHVNVSTSWLASQGATVTSYGFQTYIHEIGHALGLGHAGDYNGSANYLRDASYANDSWQASVMSYFSETENGFVDGSFGNVLTPQLADILAIQNLYGVSAAARGGDTTYGVGATSDANVDILGQHATAIYDWGGIDTINLESKNDNQRLDLNAETFSDLNGASGNFAIARAVQIENAILGGGSDSVKGNLAANEIYGGGGSDTIEGNGGNDTLRGGAGADVISGGAGRDVLEGGNQNDILNGGNANDKLYGGPGRDRLDGGVSHDKLYGGSGHDKMFGSFGNDLLFGGNGNDKLDGGNGNDRFLGGNGKDTIQGRSGDDIISGGADDDRLVGGKGNDLYWGDDGADTFHFDINGDQDVIRDFTDNIDTVELDNFAFTTVEQALTFATEVGSDVFFDFGGGDTLTVLNISILELNNDLIIV